MEHLIMKLAHLIILKQNMAVYDYLCDDFDLDPKTIASLRQNRDTFIDHALHTTLNTRSAGWLVMSGINVHKDRLEKEIERNRELRFYVNEIKKLWLANKESGGSMPQCTTEMLLTPVEATDDVFRLPESVSVTDLCDYILWKYYYKNEPDVVAVLSLVNDSELHNTSAELVSDPDVPRTPNSDSCSSDSDNSCQTTHIESVSTDTSTTPTLNNNDMKEYKITSNIWQPSSPEYAVSQTHVTCHTPHRPLSPNSPGRVMHHRREISRKASCILKRVHTNGAQRRREKLMDEMEGTRQRMAQWLHDQSANYKESVCQRKKSPAATNLMMEEKRRMYQASPRSSPGRSRKQHGDRRNDRSTANDRLKYC